MADNVGYTPGSGATVAADDIAGVLYQRVKIGIGADGTAVDLSTSNPMPISTAGGAIDVNVGNFPASQAVTGPLTDAQLRASAVPTQISDPSGTTSFGPITSASTELFSALDTANENSIQIQLSGLWDGGIWLQASNDGSVWFAVKAQSDNAEVGETDTINSPDLFSVPVVARYFRAITSPDFSGSVSGSYAMRSVQHPTTQIDARLMDLDPSFTMPVAGVDPNGNVRRIAVAANGGVAPADGVVIQGSRLATQVGTLVQFETTGYGTILLQLTGTFSAPTVRFQVSNDGTSWSDAFAWTTASAATPVNITQVAGLWVIPAAGRFFRAQVTVAGTGLLVAIAVLKNWSAWTPTSAPSVNLLQIAGASVVNGGSTGVLSVGGNIAEDSAATSNPLICGGVARTALPAATVVAGDAIRQTFSRSGQLITKEGAPGDLDFYVNATVTTNVQTQLRAAQAAGIIQNVTQITYQNTNATATTLTIQDGAATTLITFSVPASMTEPRQLVFPTPLRGTAATALNYTAGTTGANVLLNVTGFNSY